MEWFSNRYVRRWERGLIKPYPQSVLEAASNGDYTPGLNHYFEYIEAPSDAQSVYDLSKEYLDLCGMDRRDPYTSPASSQEERNDWICRVNSHFANNTFWFESNDAFSHRVLQKYLGYVNGCSPLDEYRAQWFNLVMDGLTKELKMFKCKTFIEFTKVFFNDRFDRLGKIVWLCETFDCGTVREFVRQMPPLIDMDTAEFYVNDIAIPLLQDLNVAFEEAGKLFQFKSMNHQYIKVRLWPEDYHPLSNELLF